MNWESLLSPRRQRQSSQSIESSRSSFEQDFDRIIFSHPFRRLQDKTQVHPLPEHDFVHTRLTHSLEVSSVGRSLGRKAGEVIIQRNKKLEEKITPYDFGAITAAASLAHDLGNPPFGHAGEDALGDFFKETEYGNEFRAKVSATEAVDLLKFEGNAQGFRILNSNSFGLRLTNATLGAFTKYPCGSSAKKSEQKRKSQKKFGYFQTEAKSFAEVATTLGLQDIGTGTWLRHPLAFLVEAADDICYNVIDLEDGCRLGLISFADTVELLAGVIKEDFDPNKLTKIKGQNEKLGVLRAMAIRKLVDECTEIFIDQERNILDGSFDEALTDHCPSKDVLGRISAASVEKIYRSRNVLEIEASGHEILPGILNEFLKAGELIFEKQRGLKVLSRKYQNIALLLPAEFREEITQSESLYIVARHILDFISGLTDKHALNLYRKIKGISL